MKKILGAIWMLFASFNAIGDDSMRQIAAEVYISQFTTKEITRGLLEANPGEPDILVVPSVKELQRRMAKYRDSTTGFFMPPIFLKNCNLYMNALGKSVEINYQALILGFITAHDMAYIGDLNDAVVSDDSLIFNTFQDICKEDRTATILTVTLLTYDKLTVKRN